MSAITLRSAWRKYLQPNQTIVALKSVKTTIEGKHMYLYRAVFNNEDTNTRMATGWVGIDLHQPNYIYFTRATDKHEHWQNLKLSDFSAIITTDGHDWEGAALISLM